MCTQIRSYRKGHNLSRFLRRPREACSPKWQLIYLGCAFKLEREDIGGIITQISTHNETSQELWLHIGLIDMSLEFSLGLCEFVRLSAYFSFVAPLFLPETAPVLCSLYRQNTTHRPSTALWVITWPLNSVLDVPADPLSHHYCCVSSPMSLDIKLKLLSKNKSKMAQNTRGGRKKNWFS